jgi:hypothetical protein
VKNVANKGDNVLFANDRYSNVLTIPRDFQMMLERLSTPVLQTLPTQGLTKGHSVETAAINGEVFVWKALHKPTNGGLRPVKRRAENAA